MTLAFLLVGTAIAGTLPRWSDDAFEVPYWVGADLGAAGLDDAAALAEIAEAFDRWRDVECFDGSFPFSGRVKDAAFGNPADGRNTVFVVGKDWPDNPLSSSGVRLVVDEENVIREGDIALNAVDFQFAVDGDGHVALDLQSVLTHEIGHLLGLEDLEKAHGATMNPQMSGQPDGRSLEKADLFAVCELYGSGTDSGLSPRTEQGYPCARNEDCNDGFVCVVDNGDQYCAARCGGDGECGSGTSCRDPGSGSPVCIVTRATGCGVVPRTNVLAVLFVAVALLGRRR